MADTLAAVLAGLLERHGMNELETTLRRVIEDPEAAAAEEEKARRAQPAPASFGLNDNHAIARAIGADTLDGNTL